MRKQIFFLVVSLFFVQSVFAINATSTSYSVAMFGNGLQTSQNSSSSTYNATFLLTSIPGTRGANTSTYTVNIGFFGNVSYNRTVSISSYSISPTSAVVGSTISLSISALNAQAVWANITSPNNQEQRLTLVNGVAVDYLPSPSVVGIYNVTFYANSSTGALSSATSQFVLTAQSTSTSTSTNSGSGNGGGSTTVVESCTYNWDCTPWSLCSDGKQTRECKNIGTCTGTESKPIEEMSCSQALFDIILKLKNINLTENKSLLFSFNLIEQIGVEKLDVHIKYSIIDSKNNEIFSRIETRAVQGNLSVEEEIDEIEFKDEEYILRVDILYGNLQRAFAEQKFIIRNGKLEKISGQEPERERINLTVLLILLILILAIIIVIILLKRKRKKYKKAHKHKKSWLKHIFVGAVTIGGIALLLKASTKSNIVGFAVNEISKKASSNLLWILLLLLLFGLLFVYRKKILPKYFSNKILDLIDKEVYTDSGDYIGKVGDVIIEKNKIDSLKIKLDSKKNYIVKGLIIKYADVKAIKRIVIIKNFEIDKITI